MKHTGKPEIPWDLVGLPDPPKRLDDRVDRLIKDRMARDSASPRGIPVWIVATACTLSLVAGLGLGRGFVETGRPDPDRPASQTIWIPAEAISPGFFVVDVKEKPPIFQRRMEAFRIEISNAEQERDL